MNKGEAIFKFIDKYAYFSCAANIVFENYTVSDGVQAYNNILNMFEEYLIYYNELQDCVLKGQCTWEDAERSIETCLIWFSNEATAEFLNKMNMVLVERFGVENQLPADMQKCFDELAGRVLNAKFSTNDLRVFIEQIRRLEEERG